MTHWSAFPKLHDRAWLAEKYLQRNRKPELIAREADCHVAHVYSAVVAHGLLQGRAHNPDYVKCPHCDGAGTVRKEAQE